MYGLDATAAGAAIGRRRVAFGAAWPARFLYVGRYAPEKGLDTLLAAYAAYRAGVADPWPLTCCGAGPLAGSLANQPGVEDRGFVQPADQPAEWARAGAFVLASRYEPWGVAAGEACAAGLPVICTEAVGAGVELVRSYYNGLRVPTDDVPALARALTWAHRNHDRLERMGAAGVGLAMAYDGPVWAERVAELAAEILADS